MSVTSEQLLLKCEFEEEYFAFFLDDLSQIILIESAFHLTKAPDCIYGIANYKGKILTVINMPHIVKKQISKDFFIGVLAKNLTHIGLILGTKIETLMVSFTQIKPLSEERANLPASDILEGEFLDNGRLIYIISINKLYHYLYEEVQTYLRKSFRLLA